jgi:hypothetical protein
LSSILPLAGKGRVLKIDFLDKTPIMDGALIQELPYGSVMPKDAYEGRKTE